MSESHQAAKHRSYTQRLYQERGNIREAAAVSLKRRSVQQGSGSPHLTQDNMWSTTGEKDEESATSTHSMGADILQG